MVTLGIETSCDETAIALYDSNSAQIIAEKVYSQRYRDNKDLKYLYNILICQILQRNVASSEKTINQILDSDYSNGNAQLAKAIINIYLLDKKDARIALNNVAIYERSK